jgi:hypothetical protein
MVVAFARCERRLNTVVVLQEAPRYPAVGFDGAVLCTEFCTAVKTSRKTKMPRRLFGAASVLHGAVDLPDDDHHFSQQVLAAGKLSVSSEPTEIDLLRPQRNALRTQSCSNAPSPKFAVPHSMAGDEDEHEVR